MMAMSSFSKHSDCISLHHFCAFLSVLSKLRFIHPVMGVLSSSPVWGDQTPLAIVEWTDVGLILIWTVSFLITNSPKVRVGICKIDSENQSKTTMKAALLVNDQAQRKTRSDNILNVAFFSMRFLATIAVTWFFVCLFVCLAFMLHQGRIPSGHVPYISDMWVYPPGDWISRNMVMGGSVCAILVHICFYFAGNISNGAPSGCLKPSSAQTCLCVVSLLGLSVVGCVNESENGTVHAIAATTFFACYDVYMFWTFLVMLRVKGYNVLSFILTLCSVLSKVRFMSTLSLGDNTPEILEWLDALVLIAFFWSDSYYHSSVSDLIGVLIYREEAPPARSFV